MSDASRRARDTFIETRIGAVLGGFSANDVSNIVKDAWLAAEKATLDDLKAIATEGLEEFMQKRMLEALAADHVIPLKVR